MSDNSISFAVVYQFKVKNGMEETFIQAWKSLTELIAQYEGGLGSRLHKNQRGEFIAYAQWPNRAAWENSGVNLPHQSQSIRQTMRDCCYEVNTQHELDVVTNLLI
ncbi:MAG: antibiotic biosynthesis monooxygenase family protein [Flavobacteriales bacterium]